MKRPLKPVNFALVTPAKGVKGIILFIPNTSGGGEHCLRIYQHPPEYRVAQSKLREKKEPFDEKAWAYQLPTTLKGRGL
jgi:hypothetical protein